MLFRNILEDPLCAGLWNIWLDLESEVMTLAVHNFVWKKEPCEHSDMKPDERAGKGQWEGKWRGINHMDSYDI